MLRRAEGSRIPIKSAEEISQMRAACGAAAWVLEQMAGEVREGQNTYDLDQLGRKLIAETGAVSACYGYQVGTKVFPAYTCLSVNEEVVHGIGSLQRVLRSGDVLTLDVSLILDGWVGDNARTLVVGEASAEVQGLLEGTEQALAAGIEQARAGNDVNDISRAVQRFVEKRGYSVVREFVGHGVGRSMHEEPQIPNFDVGRRVGRLYPGMTLAIEPMVALGKPQVMTAEDGWTAYTRDGSPSAHFEHTVLVTRGEPEILTLPKNFLGKKK